tara:strand:+ start:202 stop:366 length:165 start_codon:yes stop_codon:yes gene_type:complete
MTLLTNKIQRPKPGKVVKLTTTIPPLKGPVPQGLPYGKENDIKMSGLKNGRTRR